MNDLFTVLIILFVIISLLNKIFGQKKQQQTSRRPPIPAQKPKEWIPPWLEPDEPETSIPAGREDDFDIIEKVEYQQASFERPEDKVVAPPTPPIFSEEKIRQGKTAPIFKLKAKPLEAFNIELSSRDELKRGIVLAEILGPCRARRRLRRI